MKGMAFEITPDDLTNVLASNTITAGIQAQRTLEKMAEDLFGDLDFERIEDAALCGNAIDEQLDYVHGEITRQLIVMGVLRKDFDEDEEES